MRPAFFHSVCGGSGRSPLFLQFLPHQIRQGEAVYIFVHGRIQARPEVQGRADAAPLAGILLRLQAGHRGQISLCQPEDTAQGILLRRFRQTISPQGATPAAEESRLSQQTRSAPDTSWKCPAGRPHPSRRRTPPRRGPPHRSSGAGRTAPWSKSSRNRLLFCPIYFATGASGMQETAWIFPAPPAPEIDNRPLFPYNKNNF